MGNFKKLSFLVFSFIFLFFIFLIPLISFASFIPTGSPCNPEIIPDERRIVGPVLCPFCPNKGSVKLHLKWEIVNKTYTDPICLVSCSRDDGDSCVGANRKDSNGLGTTTVANWTTDLNIKPKDDIFMATKIKEDNKYQVSCCERCKTGDSCNFFCKRDSSASSVIAKVVEVGCQNCTEYSFQSIINSLNSFQPTLVSEKNFKGWSSTDSLDVASRGGSGEKEDVKNAMIGTQCSSLSADVINQAEPLAVLSYLKGASDKRAAVPLNMLIFNQDGSTGAHILISLNVTASSTNSDAFSLRVLDSKGPGVTTLSCITKSLQKKLEYIPGKGIKLSDTPGVFRKFTGCDYGSGSAVLLKPNTSALNLASLQASAVRANTADYLGNSDNYPGINNDPVDSDGFCFGWTDFVLKGAYLGNFVGKDCHPDGTLSQIEKKQNFWLANAWSAWYNILN